MSLSWLENLIALEGVKSAHIVDSDGLIVGQGGETSDQLAPHSALMVKNLVDKVGLATIDGWQWTQCRTGDVIIAISNVFVGILVIMMDSDADLGEVRKEAGAVRRTLLDKFKPQFGGVAKG